MSTEQVNLEEVWQHATAEQTENTPETPVEAPTEAKAERSRDDKGRFASASPEPTSQEAPQESSGEIAISPEPEAKDEGRIPSWRLKEEAERRREAEQQLSELKNEFRQMQMQWMAQQRQPQAPQVPQEAPDIFADPQGFIQNLQTSFDDRIKTVQLENSLRFAHYTHGDKFNEAYQNFTDHVAKTRDQATYQRVMASPDPGEALVQWQREQELAKQLNGKDLGSFLSEYEQQLLAKPEFQAKVIEAFKATQQQSQPSNTINLPPSLSRASASKSAHDDGGSSPQDIWNYATKR